MMHSNIFRHYFGDPLKKGFIELGDISWESVLEKFDTVQWATYLEKMEAAKQEEIHQSPYLAFENKETAHEITVSAVGSPTAYEFYIFYKRPKEVRRFFGLLKSFEKEYVSDITGQNRSDVLKVLQAFISRNYRYLDDKIK